MQAPPAPASQWELDLALATRRMAQTRLESAMQSDVVRMCIEKCVETSDLYSCARADWPIRPRLEKDMKEKSCVLHCGAKYDELMQMTWFKTNTKETVVAQAEATIAMQQAMMGGGQ